MKNMNESAVSPVVGIMLMLVVTIIIAAVVSGYAGSLTSDQSKSPQATLMCTPHIEKVTDDDTTNDMPDSPENANNGLLFEHTGGNGFSLNEISVQLQVEDSSTIISMADRINRTDGAPTCLHAEKFNGVTKTVTSYIMEYGNMDGYILPGDRFMLYADSCMIRDIKDSTDQIIDKRKYLTWEPVGVKSRFDLPFDRTIEYKILDQKSGKAIQAGTVTLN